MSVAPALNEDQLEKLALFLEDHEDALDLFAVHGLLTANNISPEPLSMDEIVTVILDDPDKKLPAEILKLIELLNKEIQALLESGEVFPVPCDLNVEADEDGEAAPLESWCSGFMLLCFEQEDAWYEINEEEVGELLYPILYASGMAAEEPEFIEIDDNPSLSAELCEAIPDNVVELFLLFRVDEKK